MKLGARMLKTGIAITLALYIAQLLNLPSPIFAGIAAIFAIQPTIYRSYLSVVEQVQGNIIGAVLAVGFYLLFGSHVLIIGLTAVITIVIMVKLKLESSIRLALVTIIAIMEAPSEQFLYFASLRTFSIFLGILSAIAVNFIFLPPKYETRLFQSISDVTEDVLKWIRLSTRFASEDHLLKKDIETIKKRIAKVNQFYTMYEEEPRYFKKKDYAKLRKLVLYQQMIQVTQKSFDLLKLQHQYETTLQKLSESLQAETRERLDYLIGYHEQLLLKYMGRVRQEAELDDVLQDETDRNQLRDSFLKEIRKTDPEDVFQPYHLMRILSAILDYEEQLEHLDKLINSFQTYHEDESQVDLT
ncbi:aromatic acid exporter family protein [Siminovitchia sediminis]|uniref:Aromatic acid exporter family protein n=1 Tax=Siminovitchia sediminis TaxID=1274353 RepID=A0ABW4KPV0_9BACI